MTNINLKYLTIAVLALSALILGSALIFNFLNTPKIGSEKKIDVPKQEQKIEDIKKPDSKSLRMLPLPSVGVATGGAGGGGTAR